MIMIAYRADMWLFNIQTKKWSNPTDPLLGNNNTNNGMSLNHPLSLSRAGVTENSQYAFVFGGQTYGNINHYSLLFIITYYFLLFLIIHYLLYIIIIKNY